MSFGHLVASFAFWVGFYAPHRATHQQGILPKTCPKCLEMNVSDPTLGISIEYPIADIHMCRTHLLGISSRSYVASP